MRMRVKILLVLIGLLGRIHRINGWGWSDVSNVFEDATSSIQDAINDVFGEGGLAKLSDSVEGVGDDVGSILSDISAIKTFFDSIKDNVADVLDDVETVFDRNWYSNPTTTSEGLKLYEATKTLSDAIGIPLNDVAGVKGFCTYITDTSSGVSGVSGEWLNFLKAGAELFTQFITSNSRRLKSFKEFDNHKRQLQTTSKSCTNINNYTLCNYAEAVFTEGIWYDYVVKQPLKLDLTTDISQFVNIGGSIISNDETYTDGNLLAFFILLKQIIDTHDISVKYACKSVIDVSDPLITDCVTGLVCGIVQSLFHIINEWFSYILSNADYHDSLTAATQMQAVFDNRERIITNQKKMKNFADSEFVDTNTLIKNKISVMTITMNYEFNLSDKLIKNDIFTLTQTMNSRFTNTKTLFVNEMNELSETMNIQFDDTDNLINDEFDSLTTYLNGIFENMFNRLTIIDKLLRTPNGQRPQWNKQTFNAIGIRDHSIIDDQTNNNNMIEITQTELIIVGSIGIILFLLVLINQIIIMVNNSKKLS